MNIAEFSIRNKVLSVIIIMVTIMAGWSAYKDMSRLEDPEFTIRMALVITHYPGASPMEVAEEVTAPLESAIQQLPEVDKVTSVSSDGKSEITVEIKYEFSKTKADLQLIWNKLRNKVNDAQSSLPPGATEPVVADDFGDLFGLYYFLTGEGFTPAELRQYAKDVKKEILQVDGVARVSLAGELEEAIFVEFSRESMNALGLSRETIYSSLQQQNLVMPAGDVQIGDQQVVIAPSGAIDSVDAIANTLVATTADGRLIFLKDIATVSRDYQTPPETLMRLNRQFAIGFGVSIVSGGNVVQIGEAVDRKLRETENQRPLGIDLHEYYHQGKAVDDSVKEFMNSVIAALVIVFVTLLIFMGLRSAVVIGLILLLTILATLAVMDVAAIPMHRISLGALIIALGMMVDNAIVVTEGILVGIKQGRRKREIAKEIVAQTQWPLLGGTLVGCIAFAPIGFAPGDTAEYTGHLFWVILISLMISWLFAITLTPLLCYWLLDGKSNKDNAKPAGKDPLAVYKRGLQLMLRYRWLTLAGMVGLFVTSIWGAQFMKPGFFPTSTTPQIIVDFWLPQGSALAKTQADIEQLEDFVSELPGVEQMATSIGGGGLRYMLVYSPESPNSSYAQLLIKVDDYSRIDTLLPKIQDFADRQFPNAQTKVWRFILGPGGGSKIEARFSGPDPDVLRNLADQAKAIMLADGQALMVKDDWRQPVSVIEPIYSESEGRQAGISREDVALALQTHFKGRTIGHYRERDDMLPIISRSPASERKDIEDIHSVQVVSQTTGHTVPIGQVTDGFRTTWRDSMLRRENRVWTIHAQSDPMPHEMTDDLFSRIRPQVESIDLPAGYSLTWEGEYGDAKESNENLASTLPMGFMAMVIVVFVLFGTVRQPLVIWLIVPMALIGVVFGLVVTQTPMEFMAILGVLSLSGLLIKNGIVLVDQIDWEIKQGKARFQAVIDASASRVRPVLMGASTTVLGVIPLYFDPFFMSMSVVIVFGLSFATVLTLIMVPVLYATFFGIKAEQAQPATSPPVLAAA